MIDVAKLLEDFKAQPPKWWNGVRAALPQGATGALVIAIAYQLSMLTWALVPGGAPATGFSARGAGSGVAAPRPDLAVLTDSHLFGRAAEQAQPAVAPATEAPDTTLRLSLTGILSKDGDAAGSAIIRNSRNDELAYYVGQEIELADGATLHAVYADRVLLNRGGRLEALRLPDELSAASGASAGRAPPVPRPQSSAGSLRDVISQNTGRIGELVRASPHVQEGRMIGFRLTPGRNRAAFEALGFEPGDIVTEVNGTALDDLGRGAQIFEALGESPQASVTVLRDGVARALVIDTTQLQSLDQNRE